MDLGGCINSFADWLCSAPAVRCVAGSPFFTALLITALAAVVVLATCGTKGPAPGRARTRAFVYVLLLVTGVQLVHHCAVRREACRDATAEGVQRVFSSLEAVKAVHGGRDFPVIPGHRARGAEEAPPEPAAGPRPPAPAPPRGVPQHLAPGPAPPPSRRAAEEEGAPAAASVPRADNVAFPRLDLRDVELR